MVAAVVGFVLPGLLLAWARSSGRRVLPAFTLIVTAVVLWWNVLPWLALGVLFASLALATRRMWFERWILATPFLRPLRVRRWAKAGWNEAVLSVGLGSFRAPVAPLTFVSIDESIHALWTMPLGVTFIDVEREKAALAAFFDAPRVDVKPIRPSVVALTWRWDAPLAASRVAYPPTPGTVCLADGFVLGRTDGGHDVQWAPLDPASHALVVGGTRSGKSASLQVLLGQAASMPDVQVCGVDPTGLLLAPFADGPEADLIALGTSPESLVAAVDVLEQLVDVTLAERLVHLRESRAEALKEPTEALPMVLVVIEEYPAFLAACSADDTAAARKPAERLRTRAELYLQRLLAEGLKTAIVVVIAAQRADADVLGGYRRDQMSTRLAFRLASSDGWRMAFPGHPDLVHESADLAPGEGYVATPTQPLVRFRGDYLEYGAYRDHVDQAMAWRHHHLSDIPL